MEAVQAGNVGMDGGKGLEPVILDLVLPDDPLEVDDVIASPLHELGGYPNNQVTRENGNFNPVAAIGEESDSVVDEVGDFGIVLAKG